MPIVPVGFNPNWGFELAGTADAVAVQATEPVIGSSIAKRLSLLGTPLTTTHVPIRSLVTASLLTRIAAPGVRCALSSSSAQEAAAGTGIKTVLIEYLDNLFRYQTESLTLAGQTKTTMAALLCTRILRISGTAVGSGATVTSIFGSAGTIYAYDGSDTVASGVPATQAKRFQTVGVGYSRSHSGYYTVPAGRQHTIIRANIQIYDTAARYVWFAFRYKTPDAALWREIPIAALSTAADNGKVWEPRVPLILPERTDWEITALGSAAGSTVVGEIEFIETVVA